MTEAKLCLAFAQLNPTVGDLSGNLSALRRVREQTPEADLIVTPEMYLSAYPPEDLVLKPSFQDSTRHAVERLAQETADGGPALLIGVPWREKDKLYNAMLLLEKGHIIAHCFKYDLPNYGPFDEKRVFTAGPLPEPLLFRGMRLGVMICEDMWTSACAAHLKEKGAEILIVPNGSPYEVGKTIIRAQLAEARVAETGLPLVYLNQIGGQDELVFDGASFALNAKGETVFALPSWQEKTALVSFAKGSLVGKKNGIIAPMDPEAEIYTALMVGLRDYVNKNGFPGVVLGLSGGIDSALAVALAVDALGAERVRGVRLPSPYTSSESMEDAALSARLLGCPLETIPISEAMRVFDTALTPVVGERLRGIPQENIQSRCRGLILMALSNATGAMVLATGNKSEMSVGYATLYGDMCGGFAVLKDVYKTEIYRLARWRNGAKPLGSLGPLGPVMPERVLTKAPTAELRPNQTDQDSLPPYAILDGILESLIEADLGLQAIMAKGFDPATVAKVWGLLDGAEYKRRQAPPGVKITRRALGRDRRYPMTNKYRERSSRR